MRTTAGAGFDAVALLLASASFLFNIQIWGMWYDRVGHIFINTRLWACVTVVAAWNALAVGYFLIGTRLRMSPMMDAVSLGILGVMGFSAASASTAAGYFELAHCANYDRRCAMGTTGGILNWVTTLYLLGLLNLKVRQLYSPPLDEETHMESKGESSGHLSVTPGSPTLPTVSRRSVGPMREKAKQGLTCELRGTIESRATNLQVYPSTYSV